jgi:hypothetical protein
VTAPVRVVLDASAIVAYAASSIAVGEILVEVGDEGARVGLPVFCLAEAYRRVPDHDVAAVGLLAGHPAVVVVDTDPDEWMPLAQAARDLGRVDTAAALLLTIDADGHLMTSDPDAYGDWKDLPIIPI